MSHFINILTRQSNRVDAKFTFNNNTSGERDEIIIGNVGIYFKIYETEYEYFSIHMMLDDLAKKNRGSTLYACKFTSDKLKIKSQKYICDDSQWRIFWEENYHDPLAEFIFDLLIEVEVVEKKVPFAGLYDDTELTDFELCAGDGSVKFHSAVLAAASPALRRMLAGRWTEAENRSAQTEDTNKATLQHLKDYLYLNIIPEKDVENLLRLANYYLMSELEQRCIDALLNEVTVESSTELMKFALSHNLMKLYYAFLKLVQNGGLNVEDNAMQE